MSNVTDVLVRCASVLRFISNLLLLMKQISIQVTAYIGTWINRTGPRPGHQPLCKHKIDRESQSTTEDVAISREVGVQRHGKERSSSLL